MKRLSPEAANRWIQFHRKTKVEEGRLIVYVPFSNEAAG